MPTPTAEAPLLPDEPRAFASRAKLTRAQLLAAPVRWPRPARLREPLAAPSPKAAKGLESLGLRMLGDLLEHLPRDVREARTVAALRDGEQATVAVEVRAIAARAVRRRGMRPLVEASVFDESGSMRAVFFNQPWLVEKYPPGTRLLLHGKAGSGGRFSVAHHAVGGELGAAEPASGEVRAAEPASGEGRAGEPASGEERAAEPASGEERAAEPASGEGRAAEPSAVAHYPAAEGVTSTQILTLVRGARAALADVVEPLPAALRAAETLPDRPTALAALHFPGAPRDPEAGRERLAFEELLLTQLVFLRRRARRRAHTGAPLLGQAPSLSARWLEHTLPFALTGEQRAAIAAIAADLAAPHPMQRLLMGEVGSGKTVVAVHAMLRAVEHGAQAALMAPTETLAEQHFATVQRLLGDEPLSSALLTGSTPARRRADILGKLASGELALIVGTHALIEPDVRFRSLAVAVVDEQHRFGVRQRTALEAKDPQRPPHVLHMTATPIPRTLALAAHGDLDVTALRELPHGRQPIRTRIVAGERARARAYEHVREQLRAGRQAYVVCPLVEEAEPAAVPEADAAPSGAQAAAATQGVRADVATSGPPAAAAATRGAPGDGEMRAASAEIERLAQGELKGHRLLLLHGQMRPREKQQAMAAFAAGAADVLVATTVIEVGVDVPNATVMLIENAERFGISQLHQLRGRVGRGEHASTCLLVGPPGSPRLRALAEHVDGFRLAEIDLALRKEGELVGTRQSGLGQYRLACLPQDAALLDSARTHARAILDADPELAAPEHALLGEALERAFGAQALAPIPA
ncbi:MAG TPA: ATP-dependent DNA helicase RecG [Solirubrobacteraceae bacterium]|jgi:ATP-dependent DNA helicase RecG